MVKVSILDGYVDEPTCLGVPPYISPYPRYISGAIWTFNKNIKIFYITIDQIRQDKTFLDTLSSSDVIVVIAGMSVPGRYLSGYPASPRELKSILDNVRRPLKVLCGPAARYGFGLSGGKKTREITTIGDTFNLIVKGDPEIVIFELMKNKYDLDRVDHSICRKNAGVIREFAKKGAYIVNQHPNFPNHLITEIETFRGCPRTITGGCSFCSEPSKGLPDYRPVLDIHDEIKELYNAGVRHFRLGNQPCIFSYMAKDAGKNEYPQPNPDALEFLFRGIRKAAPDLKTLHIDNANPGILAKYPKECKQIAKTIIKYHTPGDVAALGVESVDPVVIQNNNLKASPEDVLKAISLLNEVGSKRGNNGMPELLPGLNFVFGLEGETKKTYQLDYEFLEKIMMQNLLLRRINLRQVIPIPGTKMFEFGNKIMNKNKHEFQRFKRKVQENIERPMLEKILPKGTILKEIFTEIHKGKVTFGRQIGSYPLLTGIPGVFPLNKFYNIKITDYGYRSITGVPYPLDINNASRETIEALPYIGRKRALRILTNRPFKNKEDLFRLLDDSTIGKNISEYISFKK
jgi:radical SAM superfamily enzyme with C-terminal helix-hairpin-helix motif